MNTHKAHEKKAPLALQDAKTDIYKLYENSITAYLCFIGHVLY